MPKSARSTGERANELSACEAARRIARAELTSEALIRACLERIAEREAVVGAWQYLDPDLALAKAQARDRQPSRRPLHGVPIGIKDIFDTADMPTCYGSAIYEGHRPNADAAIVRMLREAGAVVLGKTVTTEFAYFSPGKTANPHRPAHTPGGSSSGSAAAVADFMVPLAFGTQTAGSVIRPAAFCGVVGFKPTHGLVDMAGIKPLAPSLDTVGLFARAVEDVELVGRVLMGEDPRVPDLISVRPGRVGYCRTEHWDQSEPAAASALDQVAARLKGAGVEVAEVELPEVFRGLAEEQQTIMAFEARLALAAEWRDHAGKMSARVLELVETGRTCPEARYETALRCAAAARAAFEGVMASHDLLITPSAPGEAPLGRTTTGDPVFNRIWTLLHVPCLTLPVARGPQGLPVGVQLVGRFKADHQLLAQARWIEAELR